MSDKKNIDRLFQEKFKDHEVFPESIVWKNIEKQLTKKKKRRIVPLWLRFAGAAAVLLLLITSGYKFYTHNNVSFEEPIKNIITDTNDEHPIKNNTSPQEKTTIYTTPITNQTEQNSTHSLNGVVSKNNALIKPKINSVELKPDNSDNNYITTDNVIAAEKIILPKENKDNISIDENAESLLAIVKNNNKIDYKKDIQDAIKEDDNITLNTKKINTKWSIGSTIAPVYYNTLSKGSPIDASLANNNKNSISTVSYGLKVNYNITDKFSLQSGVSKVNLGYSTENVTILLSSSLLNDSKSNINSNVDGVEVATISTTTQSDETVGARSSFDEGGKLDQTFSYVEVPFEAKYTMLQKKLGINLVGGFSTYMLYQNKVTHTSFGKKTTLGQASNLNSMNFSGNLGLDFDYNISKKLFINVSPMFKYQFNTFSESSGSFQPYYFGVYTGVNFRF